MHPDIQDPQKLFEHLSPEVRRFAIAMESEYRARRTANITGHPRNLLNAITLITVPLLQEAVQHPSVTDVLIRPLPKNHIDRNPPRVAAVLTNAVIVSTLCLMTADACGVFGDL